MPGFDQGEIEALPGVAEDFGDEAPVPVAIMFAEADLLRDDPAQIVAAVRSLRALLDLRGVDAVKADLELLPVASEAQRIGVVD